MGCLQWFYHIPFITTLYKVSNKLNKQQKRIRAYTLHQTYENPEHGSADYWLAVSSCANGECEGIEQPSYHRPHPHFLRDST